MNQMIYDTVVVGAGAAGLTAAAYLARGGYRVLLCEKNPKVGGLVSTFEQDGFVFDAGVRAFEDSGILLPMLRQLGIELPMVQNPVTLALGGDQVRLTGPESLADYGAMLKRQFTGNAAEIDAILAEIEKVMGYMKVLYGIENPLFLDIAGNPRYLLRTLLPWLFQYQKNIHKAMRLSQPVAEYLLKFTNNQALVDVITQHFFENTPTFFALSYFSLYLDYRYPKGGTSMFAEALAQQVRAQGGEIKCNTQVTAIYPNEHRLEADTGKSVLYRSVIWAADSKAFYAALHGLDTRRLPALAVQKKRVNEHRGGDSVLSVYLALDVDAQVIADRFGPHCFYTPTPRGLSAVAPLDASLPKKQCKQALAEYLATTTYEISCPVLRDRALAPQGKSGLMVSTLFPYEVARGIRAVGWYDELKQFCIDAVVNMLGNALPGGLQGRVLFALCSTPLTIQQYAGSSDGAITGWAFGKEPLPAETQMTKIVQSIKTPLPDIYQAGQWAFSPAGLPVCVLTGKLAADAVAKQLTKENG
jgi:phytoene dehydrogenase-like protein